MTDEAAHDGASGDDTITGGAGAGADTFFFDLNHGNDIVANFTDGKDLIDLSAFSTISGFSDLTITSHENGVTIDLTAHGGGTVLLRGFDIDDLDASDFLFRANRAESDLDGGGTSGNDALWADDDGDRLDGGGGHDILRGGAGDDMLLGRAGDDSLYGGAGSDVLEGGAGNDYLLGGEGADDVWGGAGNDTLSGGAGDDQVEGHGGHDELYGNTGDDELFGGEGDDLVRGGAGDDLLEGGEGDDTLHGGVGDDTLHGGEGADTFAFVAGNGADVVRDFSVAGDLIDLSGFARIAGFGDLTITEESDGVVIHLSEFGGGTVELQDVTLADLGADHFVFQSRDGWIEGDDGTNWVQGTSGDDTMDGGTGDDYVLGREGDDLIFGSEGNDRLYGDLEGQSGNDTLYGGAGDDHVLGAAGDDELYGGKGDDWVDGGTGNDELYGGAGNDTLYANWGDNTLEGGEGEDTFVFIPSPGGGTNAITDFADGEDNIDMSRIEGISGFEDLTITADGNDAVIDLSGHGAGTIRLQNTSVDDLDATDFLFDPPPATVEDGG